MKDSLGTISDAGRVTAAKVTFYRNFLLGMHEDGVERAARDACTTAIAQAFTNRHNVRLGVAHDGLEWAGLYTWGL